MKKKYTMRVGLIFSLLLGLFSPIIGKSQNIVDIYNQLNIPAQISNDDAKNYKILFDTINDARPKNFDQIVQNLHNKSLIPTILYARYTSARSASYQQLCEFMRQYPDYPDSVVIYKLALSKKPAPVAAKIDNIPQKKSTKNGAKPELKPSLKSSAKTTAKPIINCVLQAPTKANLEPEILIDFRPNFESTGVEGGINEDNHNRKILGLLKNNQFTQAVSFVRSIANSTKPENLGLYYADIIQRFYRVGDYESAINFAVESFRFAPNHSYISSWWAGLAAWQLSQHDVSLKFFEQTMASDDKWLISGAAFWAGRNLIRLGDVEKLNDYLVAARDVAPFSFYGQLASEILGENHINLNSKQAPNFDSANFAKLYKNPTIRRIFGLFEMGRYDEANRELRPLIGRLSAESAENILYFTTKLNINFASYKLAEHLERISAQVFVDALFPTQPNLINHENALSPLVYGVMRQESAFITTAKSSAGAMGLMQLMPETAKILAQKPLNKLQVTDPKTNVHLGTKYLNQLLNLKDVNGNIFYSLAGYNAGIGNVRRWGEKMPNSDDPLVYIESIPIRETRIYLERVMANYWVYGNLLNSDLSSRKDIAEGRMPKLILNP